MQFLRVLCLSSLSAFALSTYVCGQARPLSGKDIAMMHRGGSTAAEIQREVTERGLTGIDDDDLAAMEVNGAPAELLEFLRAKRTGLTPSQALNAQAQVDAANRAQAALKERVQRQEHQRKTAEAYEAARWQRERRATEVALEAARTREVEAEDARKRDVQARRNLQNAFDDAKRTSSDRARDEERRQRAANQAAARVESLERDQRTLAGIRAGAARAEAATRAQDAEASRMRQINALEDRRRELQRQISSLPGNQSSSTPLRQVEEELRRQQAALMKSPR